MPLNKVFRSLIILIFAITQSPVPYSLAETVFIQDPITNAQVPVKSIDAQPQPGSQLVPEPQTSTNFLNNTPLSTPEALVVESLSPIQKRVKELIDKNKDSIVSVSEVLAVMREYKALFRESYYIEVDSDESLRPYDVSGNGYITFTDMAATNAAARTLLSVGNLRLLNAFQAADQDHDYILRQAEADLANNTIWGMLGPSPPGSANAIYDFNQNGIVTVTDITILRIATNLFAVPNNAIQAPSNPHFFYTIEDANDGGERIFLYHVTDEGTTIEELTASRSFASDAKGPLDVSPDGTTVVYSWQRNATYVVQRINDPVKNYTTHGRGVLNRIHFRKDAENVVEIETALDTFLVDFATFDEINIVDQLPANAIQTASNPDFYYVVENEITVAGTFKTLKLFRQEPDGRWRGPELITKHSIGGRPTSIIDVSPDGQHVIYGSRRSINVYFNNIPYFGHFEYDVTVRRLDNAFEKTTLVNVRSSSNPLEPWDFMTDPQNISFADGAVIIQLALKFYRVDLETFEFEIT